MATLGVLSALPIFWTMPAALFGGAAAAAAIAMVNSLGHLGGFAAPYAIGWLSDRTHSTAAGLYFLVGALVAGALMSLRLPRQVDDAKDAAETATTAGLAVKTGAGQ